MRKFEKISKKQFKEDFKDFDVKYTDIKLPTRGTKHSAGYDFILPIDIKLRPGQFMTIPTGIKASMGEDEVLLIIPRSGQGFKYFLRLANTVGVIDSDYYNNKDNEGHIWIKIRNEGEIIFTAKKGDKIAQGIFIKYLVVDGEKTIKKKRNGGLGSTDENKKIEE